MCSKAIELYGCLAVLFGDIIPSQSGISPFISLIPSPLPISGAYVLLLIHRHIVHAKILTYSLLF